VDDAPDPTLKARQEVIMPSTKASVKCLSIPVREFQEGDVVYGTEYVPAQFTGDPQGARILDKQWKIVAVGEKPKGSLWTMTVQDLDDGTIHERRFTKLRNHVVMRMVFQS
jgi:hypothetical protein